MKHFQERAYLSSFVSRLPSNAVKAVVAHRGFHSPSDDLKRPLENTLQAFTSAWNSGFALCECDVTTTKDGKIIFGHDKTFERLALVKDSLHKTRVEQLSSQELRELTLLDNSGALYMDTVVDALRERDNAQLVVEIKSSADSKVVTEALWKHIATLDIPAQKIPLIMSFKPSVVFAMQKKLVETLSPAEKPLVMLLVERPKGRKEEKRQFVSPEYADFAMPSRWVDLTSPEVVDFVEQHCLTLGDTKLDGVYLQFDSRMLVGGPVRENLKRMVRRYAVGVFLGSVDRNFDKLATQEALQELGVSFVNTDAPNDFF